MCFVEKIPHGGEKRTGVFNLDRQNLLEGLPMDLNT